MAEAMSEERLAKIRNAAAQRHFKCTILDPNDPMDSPCDPEHCAACAIDELLAENDRLRAQLAEIGETREEYAALYTSWANSSHGETKAIGPFKTTDELLAAQESELWPIGRDSWSLGRRLAGQWRRIDWHEATE